MTGRPRIAGSPLGGGGLAALRDQTATGAEGGGTPDKPKSRPFLRRGEGRDDSIRSEIPAEHHYRH